MTNPPPDTIIMKSFVEHIETGPKIEPMPLIDFIVSTAFIGTENGPTRPYFCMGPSMCCSERFKMCIEGLQLLGIFDKRFAVVTKGQ